MAIINDPTLKKGISALASGGKKNSKYTSETSKDSGSSTQGYTPPTQSQSQAQVNQPTVFEKWAKAYADVNTTPDYSSVWDTLLNKSSQPTYAGTPSVVNNRTVTSADLSALAGKAPGVAPAGSLRETLADKSSGTYTPQSETSKEPYDWQSILNTVTGGSGGSGVQVPSSNTNLRWMPDNSKYDIDWATDEYLKDNLEADARIKELLQEAINANGLALGKGINNALYQKRLNAQTANTTGENIGAQNARDVQDTLATIQGVNSENQANIDKYMDVRRELAKDQANFTDRGLTTLGEYMGAWNNAAGMINYGLGAAQVNAQTAAQQTAASLYQYMLENGMIDINGNVLSNTPAAGANGTMSYQDLNALINGADTEQELLAILGADNRYSDAAIESIKDEWRQGNPSDRMDAEQLREWWNKLVPSGKGQRMSNKEAKEIKSGKMSLEEFIRNAGLDPKQFITTQTK